MARGTFVPVAGTALTLLAVCTSLVCASVYPSALVGLCLPGYQQTPTDPATAAVLPNASAVTQWEVSHSDFSFGGQFGTPAQNKQANAAGYMYNQVS